MDKVGKIPLLRKTRLAERGTRTFFMLGKELGGTAGAFQKKDVPLSYATSLLCRVGGIAKNVKEELRKGFFIFLFVS